ncbi:hypothetical protein D915_001734 [Fasciola hepatica]|uniref:Uncharacterized protein n=1 Tax=Fasciola hepatica TaxID=6192 RepID=A0A4E0RYR8_FASHE|nr:hypothetical protein D915_001734 [Fasciola hepatica]
MKSQKLRLVRVDRPPKRGEPLDKPMHCSTEIAPMPSCIASGTSTKAKQSHVTFNLQSNKCLIYSDDERVIQHHPLIQGYVSSSGKTPGELVEDQSESDAKIKSKHETPPTCLISGWSEAVSAKGSLMSFWYRSTVQTN